MIGVKGQVLQNVSKETKTCILDKVYFKLLLTIVPKTVSIILIILYSTFSLKLRSILDQNEIFQNMNTLIIIQINKQNQLNTKKIDNS